MPSTHLRPTDTRPSAEVGVSQGTAQQEGGEVLISGVDTGPADQDRQNLTPTEDHARFQAHTYPRHEPDNEDG